MESFSVVQLELDGDCCVEGQVIGRWLSAPRQGIVLTPSMSSQLSRYWQLRIHTSVDTRVPHRLPSTPKLVAAERVPSFLQVFPSLKNYVKNYRDFR